VNLGINWCNVPVHHSYSTYGQLVAGLGQFGSSEDSDSQQQGSGGCWGAESPDATGSRILVELPAALVETMAEQDRTQVQLRT
jgi:hypothetical protein